MLVAAHTECFPELGLLDAISRLQDLEYVNVEIALTEGGNQLSPSQVAADLEKTVKLCRDTHRMTITTYSLKWPEGPDYYRQFSAVCKLAKATKVITLTVPAGELGTPFNQEIERLRELVKIASVDGIAVGLRTEIGTLTENADTALALCDHVKGLGICLDPSHYVAGPWHGRSYDNLLKHVVHLQLRDSKKDKFQVRVGQGEIEYGKIIAQLEALKYNRNLSVLVTAQEDIDHQGEMRKLRLLLESML